MTRLNQITTNILIPAVIMVLFQPAFADAPHVELVTLDSAIVGETSDVLIQGDNLQSDTQVSFISVGLFVNAGS